MISAKDKPALRETLLKRRNAAADTEISALNQSISSRVLNIPQVREARAAFVYVSTRGEVDSRHLIDELEAQGTAALVPRIMDSSTMRAVRFPGWPAMTPGSLEILSPTDDTAWVKTIDVAIVPGLGFSLAGDRLGFGAGYYDRWLSAHPETFKIGVAFDYQIVERIPIAAHDVAMDMIVTESRLHLVTAA